MKIFFHRIRLSFYRLAALAVVALLVGCGILHEADIPVLKSEIEVVNDDPRFLPGNFKWLDNEHIIALKHDHFEPLPKGGGREYLNPVIWDIATNKTRGLPQSDVGGLCALNGKIRFFTREISTDTTGMQSYIETRQYYQGVASDFRPLNLREPIDLVSCESKEDKLSLPSWAQAIPDINLINLNPEHGFIWIDRDAKDLMQKPKGLWLFPSNASQSQGIDISKIMGNYNKKNAYGIIEEYVGFGLGVVKYYQYKQAYLAYVFGVGWWIYPNGKLESFPGIEKTKFKFDRKSLSEQAVSLAGMVFGTSDYVNLDMDKNDGLFLRNAQLDVKRLVSGRIGYELEVSPDGCRLAYGVDRSKTLRTATAVNLKLEVINLCKEK